MTIGITAVKAREFWVLTKLADDGRFVWWSTELDGWIPDVICPGVTGWPTPAAALAFLQLSKSHLQTAPTIEVIPD